jgi:hypothetical protein
MVSSSKKIRLKVESLIPDGTLFKGYNIKLVPFGRDLLIEFDIPASSLVGGAVVEDALIIKPEALYEIAEKLHLITRMVETKADPMREKTLQDAAKSAAKKR